MAPHAAQLVKEDISVKKEPSIKYKLQIKWSTAILIIFLHLLLPYAAYVLFVTGCKKLIFFSYIFGTLCGIGVTGGAHRLWCHRSFKARLPLRILLATFHSMAAETDLYVWCRDHRVHHKYSETDADPHNIKRGFFFAHCGWLMCRKHPDVTAKGKTMYFGDLLADPVVRFQRKFHIPLALFLGFYLPTMLPIWLWDESLHNAFFANFARYVILLNLTWSVNSFAHLLGDRPFDKSMDASEHPLIALVTSGEGWHNYHHVFPWDYSSSELGSKCNLTKIFIDLMAWLGLAYDLKQATKKEVERKKATTGDGSRWSSNGSVEDDGGKKGE